MIIWNNPEKPCTVVEFSCPNDVNVSKKAKEKEDNYGPLLRALQLMSDDYKFTFIPIIVGASCPKELNGYIRKLGFNEIESIAIEKICFYLL